MLVEAAAAASARRRSRVPLVAGAARGLKALNTLAEAVRSMGRDLERARPPSGAVLAPLAL